MSSLLKLLGVHGLGDHRTSPWKDDWERAVRASFPSDEDVELEFAFMSYDDIFETTNISGWQTASAVGKLVGSGLGNLFGARRRGLFDSLNHKLRWYAGYVVAWVESEEFQKQTRERLYDHLRDEKPDMLLGHSLGSLVTYDALSHSDLRRSRALRRLLGNLTYITLGSQIGNPFVIRNLTPGRIAPLDVKQWFHLYNEEDDIFTAPIRLWDADNFSQVQTYFDIEGWADHSAPHYLSHPATVSSVWIPAALEAKAADAPDRVRAATRKLVTPQLAKRSPRRRALLFGINEYPDPAARLEGCVNDVYLMSSLLQECGFEAEQIRVCLNDRATAAGILDRTDWLLDDPRPGDELVFYYSGHGARLPSYGEGDIVDRMDESLVPHDFDWSPETSVTDDQIFMLYSQLPYDTRLVMIFDCCHSGGIHRAGAPKPRGIDPPDDIRHRAMRWNSKLSMWEPRDLQPLNRRFSSDEAVNEQFAGRNLATSRLGRAMTLRALSEERYQKLERGRRAPVGPYLPVIFEACQEDQYAYEYRHGVTSYGAFTYSLGALLRQKKAITFSKLVDEAAITLSQLGYDQEPQILGPDSILKARVPWKVT